MAFNEEIKSNRLLQSRRFTQDALADSQEAFTRVLDLGASEIYTQTDLIPTSSLPFSGSDQDQAIYSVDGKNILKYWYRQRLTPSDTLNSGETSYNTWFFISGSNFNSVNSGIIQEGQQVNFVSPKYAPSLGTANTEGTPPGYLVRLHNQDLDVIIDPATYTFDYKTGIVQFNEQSLLAVTADIRLTAYQYIGETLDTFIASGSGGTGTGFPFSGNASITGSLTVSGSGITVNGGEITLITSSITSTSSSISFETGSITINTGSVTATNFIGTASWANNVVSASYAQNAQNILPTLFQIPELFITGSGLVISSSLPTSQRNAIRIGNSELVDDYGGYFTFNIGSSLGGWAFSGSLEGLITTLNKNTFRFYENLANYNFKSDATNFTVYKSESNNDVATTAFDVNRQTGLLYASGGASISGSANIQNGLTVGGASTLNSLTVTNDATITGNLTVNGTTTYINVDNLLVEDKFILLNSGSTGGTPNEGGIIVQTTSSEGTAYGTALYYDQQANRWVVNRSGSVAWNATSSVLSAQSDFIVTVTGSVGAPTGSPVNFGTTNYFYGQMYIQTDTSDIYIYA
jgi:hypothetical protein